MYLIDWKGNSGFSNERGKNSKFSCPKFLTLLNSNTLACVDSRNYVIRIVSWIEKAGYYPDLLANQTIQTFAGKPGTQGSRLLFCQTPFLFKKIVMDRQIMLYFLDHTGFLLTEQGRCTSVIMKVLEVLEMLTKFAKFLFNTGTRRITAIFQNQSDPKFER